eukprot:11157161-Lingulodinium_polyedra.AAC.1
MYCVRYVASHRKLSVAGVRRVLACGAPFACRSQMRATRALCDWLTLHGMANQIHDAPRLASVWLGALGTKWMIERGGV